MRYKTVPADIFVRYFINELYEMLALVSKRISAFLQRALISFVVNGGTAYLRLLGITTRVTFYGKQNIPRGPFVYAFWHCRLLFLVYSHRHQNIKVLVSKSKDGELIASVVHKFGFGTIRGSSSRAGRESALQLVKSLREGDVCGITPDGPRGPARKVKDGVSFVARKTGCPIVPITCSLKRKKLLGSWDSFMLPLPFNKAVVIVGKPLFVKPEDDLQAANLKIGETLDAITADADRLVQAL